MTKIDIIGTSHSSRNSKKKIINILRKNKYDAVFIEGVEGFENILPKYLLKEPILFLIIPLYKFFLDKAGSEFTLVRKICSEQGVSVHNIDCSALLLLEKFHKWYNYLIFIITFTIIMLLNFKLIYLSVYIAILFSLIVASIIYFFYFAMKTKKLRDVNFSKITRELILENKYKSILVVFGKLHRKQFKKNYSVNDLT